MLFEVCLKIQDATDIKKEIVKHVLVKHGVSLKDIVELDEIDGKSSLRVYLSSPRASEKFKKALSQFPIKGVTLIIHRLLTRDWRDVWKKSFKPFALTARFDVVPIAHKKNYKSSTRMPIFIDTSLAFGTGLHETTQFMARLIERQEGKFSSFLDIGTGTGILAIVAKKCKACYVKAVDIDKQAVKIAQENFRRNAVTIESLKREDIGKSRMVKKYDFVAANLVTQDLIAFKKRLVSLIRSQKYLAVSGISLENISKFKKAFRVLPLRLLKIIKGKEWAALLYQRIS
ncbi:MAG TPA: 50S ribosomal protein L11 methyltransferase [Candidatus Omnitrophota bacterium]|nr:50S ribosomal protein L11 methyltransferase [Candidatus Omnitrophota bacterium]